VKKRSAGSRTRAATQTKLGFDPIQSDLINVEPQNPVELSFWRETCPVLNLAALIPKLDAEPAVHSPSSAH
jgi:hypothetical protein